MNKSKNSLHGNGVLGIVVLLEGRGKPKIESNKALAFICEAHFQAFSTTVRR